MYSVNLLKKSFLKSIDINLFKSIFIYYLLISIIYEPIQSDLIKKFVTSFYPLIQNPLPLGLLAGAFGLITGIVSFIFTTVLLIALRSSEEESKITIPRIENLLIKNIKIYRNTLVSGIFIALGFLCFIFPGVILWKRYIYVPIISEREESIGPIAALTKSREIAEINGWFAIRSILYLIAILTLFGLLFSGFITSDSPIFKFLLGWFLPIVLFSISFYGFKDAVNSQLNQ